MTSKLYVGNLAYHATEESLRPVFAQFGDVVEVKVVLDRETGRSRGFAFVTMGSPEMAQKAMTELNGAVVEGRPLRVNEAEDRRGGPGGGGGGFRGGGGGRSGGGGGGGPGGGGGGGGGGDGERGRGGGRGGRRGGGGGRDRDDW